MDGEPFEDYVRRMATDGTYADHITIQMTSDMLRRNVRIVTANSNDVVIGHYDHELTVGYLKDNLHYVSLNTSR